MAQKRSTSNLWFCKNSIKPPRGGGGGGNGYSWEFLVGACRPVLQILTPIQTKICHFLHPFSDAASKIRTRFQTCHIFLKSHFEFVYIFIWNWNDKYIYSCSTVPGKSYPIPDQNGQNVWHEILHEVVHLAGVKHNTHWWEVWLWFDHSQMRDAE